MKPRPACDGFAPERPMSFSAALPSCAPSAFSPSPTAEAAPDAPKPIAYPSTTPAA